MSCKQENKGCGCSRTNEMDGGAGRKKLTAAKVKTAEGVRTVREGPKGGKYVKINGKMVPLAKAPKGKGKGKK